MGMVCVKNNIVLSSVAKKAGCEDVLSLFIRGLHLHSISTLKTMAENFLAKQSLCRF
jgi:hypothetical protein